MSGRLRARFDGRTFHVVLVEPEIPPNTGNIARLCGATRCILHLVGKLGFRIDDHAVRRAGLDYWHLVDVRPHENFDAWLAHWKEQEPASAMYMFTARSDRSYLKAEFKPGDALIFGKESVGLSPELLALYPDTHCSIPTIGAVRSLNLGNAASIIVYEALRQSGAIGDTWSDPS
jgi:tRNA (cytidine/uridine-2'-O-)-methyltransferase